MTNIVNCFHRIEKYPEETYYIVDNNDNRHALTTLLGKATIIIPNAPGWDSYLVIDMKNKEWRNSPSFEWLYRNTPPLTTIESLRDIIVKKYRGDHSSVAEELLMGISEIELQCHAVEKAVREGYFSLRRALINFKVTVPEYREYLKNKSR